MFHRKFPEAFPPDTEPLISFAEILSAFSYALDLTQGQPNGHCIRCCWIGSKIGETIGLDDGSLHDLYYTLLLKDLGCSSNAARITQLYLADDHAIKRDYKLIDGKLPNLLKFVWNRTGVDAPFAKRLAALANIARNGTKIERDIIGTRCIRGAQIARRLRFSEDVANGIAGLDEHWDGSGHPQGLKGAAIPLYSRVALLAQVIDVFRLAEGRQATCDEIKSRSGGWFDPALCSAFAQIAENGQFWSDLEDPGLEHKILGLAPARRVQIIDEDFLDDITGAFGDVIDAKSPYTGGHSERVANYAERIAALLGYDGAHIRKLRRAAALHDIGKLGVSNRILDKPGKLDEAEWRAMRNHTHYTTAILGRISMFKDMAGIAGAHHERLDGTGYPHGMGDSEISLDTRIITVCDHFDALTSDRPYRPALSIDEALTIIEDEVDTAIDARCFAALKAIVLENSVDAARNYASLAAVSATRLPR